jgi:hypothetical protein
MALGTSPSTFTVTGSGFTPNGSVTINILNSSGSVISYYTATADSNGALNGSTGVSLPSSLIDGIGSASNGTYNGSVQAVDVSTSVDSNKVSITLTVQIIAPSIAVTPTAFTYTET